MKQRSGQPPAGRIERLDGEDLEARLRDAAHGLYPDRVIDDLEVRHLIRVVTECALLLGDVYSDRRIARVIGADAGSPIASVERLLDEAAEEGDVLRRVRRLPDEVRVVGDKALFDHGLLGLRRVKGLDLVELGAQAYRRAGELLELLAEDRRLCQFFKDNRLLMLPLEEEVVFLRQCSDKFRQYADILKHTHGASGASVADVASRVGLMAAAAAAIAAEEPAAAAPAPTPAADAYVAAARAEGGAEVALSRERLLSGYERILLFAALDLPRLEAALSATVVDQPRAVSRLCDDFSLFAAGTRDPHRPPAYFLVGPTGVGKNHLVESLVCLLQGVWGIEVPRLTIEGPNYTYPSDINELRGATRGFIRSDEDGLLTAFHERSRRAPLAVILVDEVEKAHPHLLTFFLSILDRGTTTDNRGTVLDFSNCMVFFTSNLGYSDAQQRAQPIGYGDEGSRRKAADGLVRRGLRGGLTPEFLNRVRTVHFERLGPSSAGRILDLELERIARRYRELHGLDIEVAPCARAELIRRGFSPEFGARHLASTLEAVCNVDIARKVRRDDRADDGERQAWIDWLREMRSGARPFSDDEVRRQMADRARARLDYDALRVEFREGEFRYAAERRR